MVSCKIQAHKKIKWELGFYLFLLLLIDVQLMLEGFALIESLVSLGTSS